MTWVEKNAYWRLYYYSNRKMWRRRKVGSVRQRWSFPRAKMSEWDSPEYCTVLRKTWKFV